MRRLTLTISMTLLIFGCQHHPSNRTNSSQISTGDYLRAEGFLPKNISKKVNNLTVSANWIGTNGDFWFKESLSGGGEEYFLTRTNQRKTVSLFQSQQLHNLIEPSTTSTMQKNEGKESTNPISELTINKDISEVTFTYNAINYECDLPLTKCSEIASEVKKKESKHASPDGLWTALVINWDLYLLNNKTQEKKRITFDGTEDYPYAVNNRNPRKDFNKEESTEELSLFWSPDNKTLITHRLDRRNVGKLHLVQSVTGHGLRPRLYSYYYPLAGDKYIPKGDVISINLDTLSHSKLDIPPLLQTYYGGPIWGWWEEKNNRFYVVNHSRGNQQFDLYEYDATLRNSRLVISEKEDTFIDPWTLDINILAESNEFIWSSQRSGKQQLYLFDLNTGRLKNKMTQCDCFVRKITGLDTNNRVLYYEASGERDNEDPYYIDLYQVSFDGKKQKLLTPEPTNHYIQLSPNFDYFIDAQSTVNQVPESYLKSTTDPDYQLKIGNPDVSKLLESGWRTPEKFEVTASDQKTKLYGLIYKPSHFDPNKKYPVIDAVYTGPHGFFTPKSYWSYWGQESAIAELGFVVIKMDGRGTNKRSREFHEISYQNLAGGVDDHVDAIKQLSKTKRYMDINRVGIFGFSAGGYDTAQAMFRHPDFFKVGVSASGNHDFRTDKTGWNETWLGYPVNKHYDDQSNLNPDSIKRLKGKLLLAHGELDENVNPAATMQLVDALIKANKDFDLMIYPNQNHVLNNSDYFVRKRWDYFVRHLLKVEPPETYQFRLNE